jgi:hypothetical protein
VQKLCAPAPSPPQLVAAGTRTIIADMRQLKETVMAVGGA